MSVESRAVRPRALVDLLVRDGRDRPILLGEIQSLPGEARALEQLNESFRIADADVPYGLVADPERVRIYRWDGRELTGPVFEEPTTALLGGYSDKVAQYAGVSEDFLTTLVEAWLKDLVHRWKFERPPGLGRLESIGLVRALDGIAIQTEVRIGGPALP